MITVDLFAPLILNCLVIFAVYTLMSEGMLLEKVGNWIRKTVGDYWCKPLICCPPCMASIHGTWFYLAYIGLNWTLPVYVLALAGLNYLVIKNLDK